MAFLQVAEPTGSGYLLKDDPAVIAEHAIRQQRLVGAFAGSQVDIEPAIIVQIAEVRTHGKDGAVQTYPGADVLKSAIVPVTIKAWSFRVIAVADLEGANVLGGAERVAGDKDIRPTVVIVIKKPCSKTILLMVDTGRMSHIGELPSAGCGRSCVQWTVIAKEIIGSALDGDVQIGAAVVIEVAPGYSFHQAEVGQTTAAQPISAKVPS